jgi:membrane protein
VQPYAIITWRDVWIGAFITALFFVLGNYLIGYFLSWIAPAFAYWAASSLVVLMLWVYYSSQSLLFGAEFTKNFAIHFGDPARPADYAMFLPGKSRNEKEIAENKAGPCHSVTNAPSRSNRPRNREHLRG